MDLRDRFAAHFAAALVDAFADAGEVARRAYDLADAMLLERARRAFADEGTAIALRRDSLPAPAPPAYHAALLDEPEPMLEPESGYEEELDPRLLEPPYDPSWDVEARWSPEPANAAASSRSPGPGLARTQPEDEEAARKERSA